nr:MAG TPA: hypothetical protein [Caudoviricetes sp.]
MATLKVSVKVDIKFRLKRLKRLFKIVKRLF